MTDQRASDADRERAFDQLRRAGGDGRLTVDELDERLQQAHDAQTRGALTAILVDIADEPRALAPGGTRSEVTVRPGPGGSRWVVSVLSGATRAGRWRVAERCTVLNVLGGSDVDLNDAEFAGDVVELTVFSLLGGADIYVPEDLRVEVTDVGILGGNAVDRGDPGAERPDGPLLRLRLVSILGGTTLRRGRKRSGAERQGLRPPPPV